MTIEHKVTNESDIEIDNHKQVYAVFIRMRPSEQDLVINPLIKTWDEFKVNYCLHECKYYCKDEFNESCNVLSSRLKIYEYIRIKGNNLDGKKE